MDFSVTTAIIVMFAYFAYDILYSLFIIEVSRLHAIKASNISVLLYAIGAFGVINYVQNYLYIFPMIIGAWFGTYVTIIYQEKHAIKG